MRALPHSIGTSFDTEVVRLLADNQQLSVIVTALLQDHAYKVEEIAPYGKNLSGQASSAVIWRRTSVLQKAKPHRSRVGNDVR